MKRILLGLILVSAVGIIAGIGCRDDVFVEPPPSLTGTYTGIYSFLKTRSGGSDTLVDKGQYVIFQLNNGDFFMTWDSSIATPILPDTEAVRNFCDVEGEYTLENGIQLLVTDPNRTKQVCTESEVPDGDFSLNQSSDTMRLASQEVDGNTTTRRTLRLVRIP